MSPRSDEYMGMARHGLAQARHNLEGGFDDGAATTAYYVMFHAAQAALSEAGAYAKTHSGVWTLFSETYVKPGLVPSDLAGVAIRAQQRRQEMQYELLHATREEAEGLIAAAERFVQIIEDHFAE